MNRRGSLSKLVETDVRTKVKKQTSVNNAKKHLPKRLRRYLVSKIQFSDLTCFSFARHRLSGIAGKSERNKTPGSPQVREQAMAEEPQ